MADSTPPPAGARDRNTAGPPRWAVWAAGAVAAALVFFLIGYFVGRGPVGELRDRARQADERAEAMEARYHAQHALSLVYRATLDLDARNFGTSNERLDAAAAALGRADARAFGADQQAVQTLRQEMEATDIRVAEDLSGQRAALMGFAQRLTSLTGD